MSARLSQHRPQLVKLIVYVLVDAGKMDPSDDFSKGADGVVRDEVRSNLASLDYVEQVVLIEHQNLWASKFPGAEVFQPK